MLNLTPQERNAALFLLVTLVVGSGVLFFKRMNLEEIKPELIKAGTSKKRANKEEEFIVVHLAGAVFQPGLYRVKKGSRIGEIIKETNFLAQADISNINLARVVYDGEKIFIPLKTGPERKDDGGKKLENPALGVRKSVGLSGRININQADISELSGLPGIGEILARRIVDTRKQSGFFKNKEELKKIRGIGEKRFEKVKDSITVN